MKDASFDQRGQKAQGAKGKQHGLSFLKLLAEVNIGVAAGAAVMLFLVAVVSSATLIVHQELSQSGGESILGKAQARSKVLGYSYGYSYSYQAPTCSNNVCMGYRLFAGDKYAADINYYLQNGAYNDLRGSIKVNGKKFAYNIRESGVTSTGYSLEPGKTYNFVFYKGLQGTGKVLNKLVISIPKTPRYECLNVARADGCYLSVLESGACGPLVCPKQPSYGYSNVDVGSIPQGSWREGWLESVVYGSSFAPGEIKISGWAYDGGIMVKPSMVLVNTKTNALVQPESVNYAEYSPSVINYLNNKGQSLPGMFGGAFSVKFANIPSGAYRLQATFHTSNSVEYPFNIGFGGTEIIIMEQPPVVCSNTLWYKDSQNSTCQEKKFCGSYMYSGLKTFATQAQCLEDVKVVPTIPTNMTEFVGNLYQCVLGRTASASEKEYWAGTFTTQKTSVVDMYQNFFGGAEYTGKNKTDAEYTKQVYSCVLFRDASQTEINSQASNIATLTRKGLLSNFVNSTEFQNLKNQKLQYLSGTTAGRVVASVVTGTFETPSIPALVNAGTLKGKYFSFKVSAVDEDFKLNSVTIRVYGNFKKSTSGLGSLKNITLTTNGATVGPIMQLTNCTSTICYVTFNNLNTVILKNSPTPFEVMADIGGPNSAYLGDQFWMGLNAGTDLSLVGVQSGKAVNAEGGELNKMGSANIIVPFGVVVTGDYPIAQQTGPVSLPVGATIGRFKITNNGSARITITNANFVDSGTHTGTAIRYQLKFSDDGSQNYTANNAGWSDTTNFGNITSSSPITINGGSYRYFSVVIYDLGSAKSGDTFQLSAPVLGSVKYSVAESELGYDANQNGYMFDTIENLYTDGKPSLQQITKRDDVIIPPVVVPTTTPPVIALVGIAIPTNMNDFVVNMYQCVLGRGVSTADIQFWVNNFTTQKTSVMNMYKSFFGSAEYLGKNASNSEYAKQAYTCVLFRNPTQTEIDFQANAIPAISRDGLLSNFLNSGEFENLKSQKMQFLSGFATK